VIALRFFLFSFLPCHSLFIRCLFGFMSSVPHQCTIPHHALYIPPLFALCDPATLLSLSVSLSPSLPLFSPFASIYAPRSIHAIVLHACMQINWVRIHWGALAVDEMRPGSGNCGKDDDDYDDKGKCDFVVRTGVYRPRSVGREGSQNKHGVGTAKEYFENENTIAATNEHNLIQQKRDERAKRRPRWGGRARRGRR